MEGFVPWLSCICLKNVVFPDNSEPNIKIFNCVVLFIIGRYIVFLVVCCKIDLNFLNEVIVVSVFTSCGGLESWENPKFICTKFVESSRKPAQYFLFCVHMYWKGPPCKACYLSKKYTHALYL